MPPVMITNATPMLMIPKSEVRRMRFSRLNGVTNASVMYAVARNTTSNRPKMPKVFFIIR